MSTPQSTIYLCSGVKLNNRYEHTILFTSAEDQLAWFTQKVKRTLNDYTYLRKNWSIKIEGTMAECRKYSYLYFRNTSDDQYYFYFINDIQYINDKTVELFLELDVMQTYITRIQKRHCFVEREHTNDDTFGKNTVEENLETGELIINDSRSVDMGDLVILVMATVEPSTAANGTPIDVHYTIMGDMFAGLGIYAVEKKDWSAFGLMLSDMESEGNIDAIVSMWLYPKDLIVLAGNTAWGTDEVCKMVGGSKYVEQSISKQTTLDGFTPKNQKTLQYPYNFAYVTNNQGGAAPYKYEYSNKEDNSLDFRVWGAISPDAAATIYPRNYKGVLGNYDESLSLTGFPTCAFNSDAYLVWLAQNQNQHNTQNVLAGISTGAGIGTMIAGVVTANPLMIGSGAAMTFGAASQVAQANAQKADMQIQPPQAKGAHSVSVNVAAGHHKFFIQRKSVDEWHARMIDGYFTMYGYRVGRMKTPNYGHRKEWSYVKTIGCNFTGDFCAQDIRHICDIFDKGITFWNNGDNIGNYALDNSIIEE